MIHPALAGLIDRYQPQSSNDYQNAVREIAQFYADLHLRGVKVQYLDVGGGLGVNYGGNYSGGHGPGGSGSHGGEYEEMESTINYGLRE